MPFSYRQDFFHSKTSIPPTLSLVTALMTPTASFIPAPGKRGTSAALGPTPKIHLRAESAIHPISGPSALLKSANCQLDHLRSVNADVARELTKTAESDTDDEPE